MREIVSRADLKWPAMANTKVNRAPTRNGVVAHWNGPPTHLDEHDKCVAYWKWCRRFHMNARGWLDIGYSYGVCPHGFEFAGRTFGYAQAAQPGGNTTWVSISLMIGEGEKLTEKQKDAFKELRLWLIKTKGVKNAIKRHHEFVNTDCCGPIIDAAIKRGELAVVS